MTIRPTKLGERMAARLMRDHGVDFAFPANCHAVVTLRDAVMRNRIDGMDYAQWWLADQFGHATVVLRYANGLEHRRPTTIESSDAAGKLLRCKTPWAIYRTPYLIQVACNCPNAHR